MQPKSKTDNSKCSDIFTRNYQAVVNRNLIIPETSDRDFICKLNEEVREAHNALYKHEHGKENNLDEEITDILCVCSNWLIHRGKDPIKMLELNAEKNENRSILKND